MKSVNQYVLIGSHTSPYVRKLRMFLNFHNIAYEFKVINYLEKNDAEYLKKINPINKIPVLLDNNQAIYDSRIIFNYLCKKNSLEALRSIDQENQLSAIDTALETAVNLFMLKRNGIDLNNSNNSYIERQKERIDLLLDYLSPLTNESEWNYITMSLYSLLDWGQFREMLSIQNRPNYQNFITKFKNRKEVNETLIKV